MQKIRIVGTKKEAEKIHELLLEEVFLEVTGLPEKPVRETFWL